MIDRSLSWFLLISTVFGCFSAVGFPTHQRVKLPNSANVHEQDKELLEEALALEVYKDSENPKLFYYIPKFHTRQYMEGAASLMLFTPKISEFAEAQKIIQQRQKIHREYDETLLLPKQEEDLREAKNSLREAQNKLQEALLSTNQPLIKLYENWIAERTTYLENLREEITTNNRNRFKQTIKSFDQSASIHLAYAGHNIDLSQDYDSDKAIEMLKNGAMEASKSYGGYLSLNVYAGFTKKQLDSLRAYRAKYRPDIEVVLMPLERLEFEPLTETQFDSKSATASNSIFRNVNGSGDYLGTTLTVDTTLLGGMALGLHLAPFMVPVGIKAVFKQKVLPFDAELSCDFKDGFVSDGRTDVIDGWLFFADDLSITLKDQDRSNGACQITMHEGDISSATYMALKALENEFDKLHLIRTQLSYADKERFNKQLLANIRHNDNSNDKSDTTLYSSFLGLGWDGVLLAGLSKAADFYWSTHEQNISRLSEFKFNKRIKFGNKTYSNVERDISADLCLVYNLKTKAYDRCTDLESKQAKSTSTRMNEALSSNECKEAQDFWECATKRDVSGAVISRDPINVDDYKLVGKI